MDSAYPVYNTVKAYPVYNTVKAYPVYNTVKAYSVYNTVKAVPKAKLCGMSSHKSGEHKAASIVNHTALFKFQVNFSV